MAIVFDVQRTHSDGEYVITTDSGTYTYRGAPQALSSYVQSLMTPAINSYLLLEDGFKLLQEDGSGILL